MKRPRGPAQVSPLNLHRYIGDVNVRKLIWSYLNALDREMIWCAHDSTRQVQITDNFLILAAREGHFELVHWIIDHEFEGKFATYCMKTRYEKVHLECECVRYLCMLAGMGNQMEFVWAWDHGMLEQFKGDRKLFLYQSAIIRNQYQFLKWMDQQPALFILPSNDEARLLGFSCSAGATGNVEILDWLEKRGMRMDPGCARAAAQHGHLHILEWLLQNNYFGAPDGDHCSFARDAYFVAVLAGKTQSLDWLSSHPIYDIVGTLGDLLMYMAASSKQFASLVWLYNHGARNPDLLQMIDEDNRAIYTANGILPWILAHQ